jgi:hypothetical protein
MQLQTNDVGEAVSKPRRRRKSYWRQRWIALSNGATLDSKTIKSTMRGPKLLSTAMPRVILKEEYLQRPRSADSDFGMRFEQPALRVELANFVGEATARGEDAEVSEKEFDKMVKADRSPKKRDKYNFVIFDSTHPIVS